MTSAVATLGGANVSSLTIGYNGAFEPANWSETVYDTAGNPRTKSGAYTYQPDGLLASRAVDGQLTAYRHNAAGRETRVEPWGGWAPFENRYFDNGLMSGTTMPNGAEVDQLFDVADRLVSRVGGCPERC